MARKRKETEGEEPIETEETEESTEIFEAPQEETVLEEDVVSAAEEPEAEESPIPQPQPTTTQVREAEAADRLTASIQRGLDQYVTEMALNRPNSTKELARNQARLANTLDQILNADPAKFKDLWQKAIEYVRTHRKSVFGEHAIFRAWNQVPLSDNDRLRVEQIINLLLVSADSSNPRQVTGVVNLDVVDRYLANETQRQNLMSYYAS
jgi:predicted component of type VI protein secretion system